MINAGVPFRASDSTGLTSVIRSSDPLQRIVRTVNSLPILQVGNELRLLLAWLSCRQKSHSFNRIS